MAYNIFQFKITLRESDPLIWRRIQVPDTFTFWDLHCAIQDVMAWEDYHYHNFEIKGKHKHKTRNIGIPVGDELDEMLNVQTAWEVKIHNYFVEPGITALYLYDFGDYWQNDILFEGHLLKDETEKYPLCLEGENACPPEDSGGIDGYYRLLEILKDEDHEDHEDIKLWIGKDFDPADFNPKNVKFTNSKRRLTALLKAGC